MKPFGIISDTHLHLWSAFSTVLPSGLNSRLAEILKETKRCAQEVRKAGGNTLIHGGDLFHVRGSVSPEVLNPTLAVYKELVDSGMNIIINAGNHDLAGKVASDLGSSVTALREVGCIVVNEPSIFSAGLYDVGLTLIPYIADIETLKRTLEHLAVPPKLSDTLVIHAGIDNVIAGLPNHGLDADYLSNLGFGKVFAGHYHHHKKLAGNVWSIGALTHQTWSDVGSKAGFLIVSDDEVKWFASHAPSFIDIDERTKPEDIALLADGNYVRAKIYTSKETEKAKFREMLIEAGAKGINLIPQAPTGATRTASSVKAGASLEVSVQSYIDGAEFDHKDKVGTICQEILTEVRGAK